MLEIESPTEKRKGGKKNRDERILYALKRGGKTESNREEKNGKKQRRESFICSENGEKIESNRDEKRGEKTEKKQRGESFICSEKGEKNRVQQR